MNTSSRPSHRPANEPIPADSQPADSRLVDGGRAAWPSWTLKLPSPLLLTAAPMALALAAAVLLQLAAFAGDAFGQSTTGSSATSQKSARQSAEKPMLVTVSQVYEREVHEGQTFVGTVMPVRRSLIGSAVEGRVLEYPVNEGDWVKKGQTLAQLRTRQLDLELAAAKADLEVSRQELAELEAGALPDELDQARARLAAADALKAFAESRRARTETLRRGNGVSEDEWQQALSQSLVASQNWIEAKAALSLLERGPRVEKKAQARARALSLEHAVERLQDQIDRHTVVAPFDGYVVAQHTEIGEWVARGAPVVELIALDEVDVQVMVLESFGPQLGVGLPARVEITSTGLGREKSNMIGRVGTVVPQAELRSRSFPVKVRLPNPVVNGRPLLQAGMFARVTLPLGKPQRALMVPKDALVLGGARPRVLTVQQVAGGGLTVAAVPVDLGVSDGSMIQIVGDVSAGQRVVVHGNERLRPGQLLQIASQLDEPLHAQSTIPGAAAAGAED